MGAGILSLPLSFAWSGWALNTFFILLTGFLCNHTVGWLTRVAYAEHAADYGDVIHHVLGPVHTVIVQMLIIVGNLGGLIAYVSKNST